MSCPLYYDKTVRGRSRIFRPNFTTGKFNNLPVVFEYPRHFKRIEYFFRDVVNISCHNRQICSDVNDNIQCSESDPFSLSEVF